MKVEHGQSEIPVRHDFPGTLPPPPASKAREGRPFISLLRYNRPYLWNYIFGALIAVFFSLVGLVMPMVIRYIIDGFERGNLGHGKLVLLVSGLIVLSLVSGVARYFQRTLMIGASRKFEYDLRNDLFAHVQRLSRSFFNRTPTGEIMARATNDLNYVRDFIGPGIMGTIDTIRLPFTLAMMIYLSGRLTLVALIPMPFISLLVFTFVRISHRRSKKVQELFAVVTTEVQENLAGARVVKAHGMGDRAVAGFRENATRYMKANIRLVSFMSFAFPFIGSVIGVIMLLVTWRGGSMVIRGELDLADYTAFMIYLVMLAFPLAHLGWVLTLYQRGAVGMNRIARILGEAPGIWDGDHTDPDARVSRGHVRFEGVSFAYGTVPDSALALRDISFEAPEGAMVAIVGPTGCGKTTLVSLLAREYDPDLGRIQIDGHELRAIPLRRLRSAIGYVLQDTFIFSDTVRENLRLGRPEATDDEILAACAVAQLTEALADLPKGLDTMLGERGINLSGGQKQRLALARAILRDPRILILDDALSAVDTQTEERILDGLRGVMAGRTSFVVAHRFSTIRRADLILVMDNGAIVERGTHEELLALDGLYARMHARQLLEEALES